MVAWRPPRAARLSLVITLCCNSIQLRFKLFLCDLLSHAFFVTFSHHSFTFSLSSLRAAHLEGLWEVFGCEAYALHNQHPLLCIYHRSSHENSISPRYLCVYRHMHHQTLLLQYCRNTFPDCSLGLLYT